jgi:hypothetical protein
MVSEQSLGCPSAVDILFFKTVHGWRTPWLPKYDTPGSVVTIFARKLAKLFFKNLLTK